MTLKCTRDLQKNLERKVNKNEMDFMTSLLSIYTICNLYFMDVAIGSLDIRESV